MAWQIKSEHVNASEAMYEVVYENPELLTSEGKPQQHHLLIFLKLEACPHCGHAQEKTPEGKIDVKALKATMLARLNEHHNSMIQAAREHRVPLLHVTANRNGGAISR